MNPRLLILEDDKHLLESLKGDFTDHGYAVTAVSKIGDIPPENFHYALVDLRLSGEFGLNALEGILKHAPQCQIVILSGYGSVATAVESVKKGAKDYVLKPASFETIEAALKGARGNENDDLKIPTLSQVESEYIDYVLTKNKGNISKTAKDIGLHRQSLQRKLKKHT